MAMEIAPEHLTKWVTRMMADITRHAPLDAQSQAKHDSTEYESERLAREIPAALSLPNVEMRDAPGAH